MLKVRGNSWQTVDGVPCVVFRSLDVKGKVVEMAVPIATLLALRGDAEARLSADEFAKIRASAPPQWHHALFREVQTITVGSVETTETRKVGLILDKDLPSELSLSVSPSAARSLAGELLATSSELEQSSEGNVRH